MVMVVLPQVKDSESRLRHKLFPPNAWMRVTNFNVLISCPKDEPGVVTDTSMMTITPEFSAHFLEVYIKKTEGAKFTRDRIHFLMLSLPLAVRDLIAP